MPSPRPIAPSPSGLVTFTLTRSAPALEQGRDHAAHLARGSRPAAAPARRSCVSRWPSRSPAARTRTATARAARRSRSPRAPDPTTESAGRDPPRRARRAARWRRVQQHVAVGVTLEAAGVRDVDAAEPQRPAGHQPVRIVAVADPHGRRLPRGAGRQQPALGRREVLGSRELPVVGVPLDHRDRDAEPLDELRVVGGHAPSARWPWRAPRAAARRETPAASARPSTPSAGASRPRGRRCTRLMVSATGTARIAAPLARAAASDARHRVRPHERAGGVVHRHPLDVGGRAPRAPPAPSPGARARRRPARASFGIAASSGRRRSQRSRSARAITGTTRSIAGAARHRGERVQEQRPAGQRHEGLGHPLSEALAAARGEDESRDAHGRRE